MSQCLGQRNVPGQDAIAENLRMEKLRRIGEKD